MKYIYLPDAPLFCTVDGDRLVSRIRYKYGEHDPLTGRPPVDSLHNFRRVCPNDDCCELWESDAKNGRWVHEW